MKYEVGDRVLVHTIGFDEYSNPLIFESIGVIIETNEKFSTVKINTEEVTTTNGNFSKEIINNGDESHNMFLQMIF